MRLLNCSLELTAGCVDVTSTRTSDKGWYIGIPENFLKRCHSSFRRSLKTDSGTGIQRNQIHFCANAAEQLYHLARILGGIVLFVEQNVFEGQSLSLSQRKFACRVGQCGKIPFTIDR